MSELTALDRQKTKLLVFFSALGLAGFVLNLLAGIGLWSHAGASTLEVPTYDRFVSQLRYTDQAQIPELARSTFENWSACESKRAGMTTVAVHALVTGSVAGILFFAICLVLGWQVHQKVSSISAAGAPPQPPESVDDTWRSGR
ncbi:MAG: hypothetical protein JSU95_15635 [Betaproteobacteria bacterium]|nr:MAG: hypothetical protein JSU95_15635 [Betaproteobacteria bacterium]